jgi:hypothetical protein
MKTTVSQLVKDVYSNGTAEELMSIVRAGADLVNNSTTPMEELDLYEQAAITTLQVLLTFLTDFGVLEDVQVRH